MLFALGGKSRSFSVMISIYELCSLFLFSLNIVMFSLDGGMLLDVSKVVVYFLVVFYFSISSSKSSLESGGWTIGLSSGIMLVELVI